MVEGRRSKVNVVLEIALQRCSILPAGLRLQDHRQRWLIVGYVFMLTGWAKLNNLPSMIQNFTEWGIPAPTPFVSGVECFGGIMLILGLFTRIPAAMLAVVMLVANLYLTICVTRPSRYQPCPCKRRRRSPDRPEE